MGCQHARGARLVLDHHRLVQGLLQRLLQATGHHVGGAARRVGQQQRDCKQTPLNLIRVLKDLRQLGVAHPALYGIVFGVAVAAKDLHRVGGDLHRHVAAKALGHAGQQVQAPARAADKSASSDGRPLQGVGISVVDDDRKPLPAGQTGRLLVRGAQMFLGHYQRPDIETFDADGWVPEVNISTASASAACTASAASSLALPLSRRCSKPSGPSSSTTMTWARPAQSPA